MTKEYEVGTRVKVTGLLGSDNNSRGSIEGPVNRGRQPVLLDSGTKMKVKVEQIEKVTLEALDDFSLQELEELLHSKGEEVDNLDIEKLRKKAKEVCSVDDVADFGKPAPKSGSMTKAQLKELQRKMKLQADQLRKSPNMLRQLQSANPQLRGMTYSQVQEQFDRLATMPLEELEAAYKMQSEGDANGANAQRFAQNQSAEEIHKTLKTQLANLKKRPASLYQLRNQNPLFKDMSHEEVVSYLETMVAMSPEQLQAAINGGGSMGDEDPMANMSPEQMSKMMKMQRDMIKNNPDSWEKLAASNPMLQGMTREQVLQQMDMLADMSPDQLATYTTVAKKAEQWTRPLRAGYSKLDALTFGNAQYIVWAFLISLFLYFIDRFIYTIF